MIDYVTKKAIELFKHDHPRSVFLLQNKETKTAYFRLANKAVIAEKENTMNNEDVEYRVVRETYGGISGWSVKELPYGRYTTLEAAQAIAKRYNRPRKEVPAHNDHGAAWVEVAVKQGWTSV